MSVYLFVNLYGSMSVVTALASEPPKTISTKLTPHHTFGQNIAKINGFEQG